MSRNFTTYTATKNSLEEVDQKLEKLISACNFMMDVLDNIQFIDPSGFRLHREHPAYERLQEVLNDVTK